MKTILLTGATGFLGSYLLEALLQNNYQVVILKRSTSNVWRIEHLLDKVNSYDVDCDCLQAAFTEQYIDAVIHTACCYGRHGESVSQVAEVNLVLGLNLLDACLKYKVGIFCNTDTLLDKGINDYALSKHQFSEWLKRRSHRIQIMNMKPDHMYGSKDDATKFVPWLLAQFMNGATEVKLTSGEQHRDFIYIDDVVSAYMTVLNQAGELPPFSEFEVGTGSSIPVKSFIQSLKKRYDERFGLSPTYLNFGAIPYRDGEVMDFSVDNTSLRKLGWKPAHTLEQGLKLTIEDIKQ